MLTFTVTQLHTTMISWLHRGISNPSNLSSDSSLIEETILCILKYNALFLQFYKLNSILLHTYCLGYVFLSVLDNSRICSKYSTRVPTAQNKTVTNDIFLFFLYLLFQDLNCLVDFHPINYQIFSRILFLMENKYRNVNYS